ncbi:MAG: glutathione peroxidase [Bacteroidota bacterium]
MQTTSATKSIHQFSVKNLKGEPVSLADYEGKVLLIVNTASRCGFTPQLKQMEELYQAYKDRGFEILAFPSNNFGAQEPLEGEAIQEFCDLNFRTTFPLFDKVHVKGPEVSELFAFLADKSRNGKTSSRPRWNFHKYLIDKDGRVADFFYSFTKPTAGRVKKAIEGLL